MIRIEPDGSGRWIMRSPYDPRIVEIAKKHRGRWNPNQRVWWWASRLDARRVANDLRELEFEVTEVAATPPPPPPPPRSSNNPWIAALVAVPALLRPKVYKAVVRVLHPDQGGDLVAMQQLTSAYDQVEKAR